jgi:glucokinase
VSKANKLRSLKRPISNLSRSASIGIDVGGTKTRIALFDNKFDLVQDIKYRTPKTRKQFTAALTKSVQTLLELAASREFVVSAVGLGLAGSVDSRKGVLKSAPNIPCLKGFPFKKTLRELCHSDVVLLNDVQAALYGELQLGKAVGYKDVIAIFIGTGISGAIAIDGKLHFGVSQQAGNIGHL